MRPSLFFILAVLLSSVWTASVASTSPIELSGVTLIDGVRSVALTERTPSSRSRFGLPISKQYFIFSGRNAPIRTANKSPIFEFAATDSDVYLFRFDVRSDRREIRMAKGSGGLAELRIPADHLISAKVEELGEGPNGTRRYRLKPVAPLRAGEYCLGRGITAFYDFGID